VQKGPAVESESLTLSKTREISLKSYLSADDGLARFNRIHTLFMRRREAELFGQTVDWDHLGFFRGTDRALTLHIQMAANGVNARSGLTDVAAQKQQIGEH
jgi:hypothetical protein